MWSSFGCLRGLLFISRKDNSEMYQSLDNPFVKKSTNHRKFYFYRIWHLLSLKYQNVLAQLCKNVGVLIRFVSRIVD